MKEFLSQKKSVVVLSIALFLSFSFSFNTYNHLNSLNSTKAESSKSIEYVSNTYIENKFVKPALASSYIARAKSPKIVHKRVKRWLNGKPAMVNILSVNLKESNYTVKPSFGSYFLNNLKNVKEIVHFEAAVAGVNASYFKPDNGIPLGTTVINNEIYTGPLYKRVAFGITAEKELLMQKVDIAGDINIGREKLSLFNLNQPVFSKNRFTVFTDKWGIKTPKTSPYYVHVAVKDDRIQYIKQSSISIPKGGFVIVGSRKYFPKEIDKHDKVSYTARLTPANWDDVEYAVGGGPYLVKEGRIFIDKQRFPKSFLWSKRARTAVGYTKSGTLTIVTIDEDKITKETKKFTRISAGATLTELAQIMYDLGCYNAMNLDGGTSTQMVVNGKIVNKPLVKGGYKVTNALIILPPDFE